LELTICDGGLFVPAWRAFTFIFGWGGGGQAQKRAGSSCKISAKSVPTSRRTMAEVFTGSSLEMPKRLNLFQAL